MFRKHLLTLCLLALSTSALQAALPEDSVGIRVIAGKAYVLHKLDPGESLAALSRRYGCSVASIKAANNLTTDNPAVGTVLKVPSPRAGGNLTLQDVVDRPQPEVRTTGGSTSASVPAAGGNAKYHVIEKGQTLYGISRMYGVTVDQLKQWNQLTSNDIAAGQKLIVNPNGGTTSASPATRPAEVNTPPATQPTAEVRPPAVEVSGPASDPRPVDREPRNGDADVVHIVQRGENLTVIARKYGTTVAEIKKANNMTSDALQAGQKLIIPVQAPAPQVRPAVTAPPPAQPQVVTNYHEPEPLIDRLSTGDDTPADPGSVSNETPEMEVVSVAPSMTPPEGAKVSRYTDPWLKKTYLRIEEKGTVGLIEDFSTDQTRFYAFHRTLPKGSIIRIEFPEKNQTLLVEVVSQLAENDPYLVRVTSRVAEYLMVPQPGKAVEVHYSIPQE